MKNTRLNNIGFGQILLALAASVNLSRWVGIYTISPNAPEIVYDLLPILDAISGLLTGLSIAGGLVFVGHRLGKLQPMNRRKVRGKDEYTVSANIPFWVAAFSGLAILVLSTFLLPPYIRMSVPPELRAEIKDLVLWSVMAVLAGDLVVVAVAAADLKVAEFVQAGSASKQEGSTAGQDADAAKAGGETANASAKAAGQGKQAAKVYKCTWPGCKWDTRQSKAVQNGGDPRSALAAHVMHHNKKVQKIEAAKAAALFEGKAK